MPARESQPQPSALRAWQRRALAQMSQWTDGTFLLSAAPGAGKTRPALEFARAQLATGATKSVVVACPTTPLTRQWARAAAGLGIELAPDADSPRAPRGFHGVSVTYARIAKAPRRWVRRGCDAPLVIADEAHHLGEDLTWGDTFRSAFGGCRRWLLLSGTPFRSDATAIPGVRYDRSGLAEPDYAYTYAEAVREGICRPVCFVAFDGTLSWRSGDDVIESSFETVLSPREAGRRYRTAISTELPDGLPRILAEADAKLQSLRRDGHADAGGLVIAADSSHARRIAALLRQCTGRAPLVVLHAEPRAAQKLVHFTRSRDPWIVAVNMVSEGVDIPRLRVGVYATAAKTPLVFRQIVGRFVRTIPGRPLEPSWLYVPADPVLRNHAADIEDELRHVLARPENNRDESEFEPAQRVATERSEEPAFVPLSADVTPQMSLFGPPAVAAQAVAVAPVPATAGFSETDPNPDRRATFERREALRSERHRLVSEVTRRDRTDHREVNAWLNRRLGIKSVDKATVEELERSVQLLVRRLSNRR